MTSPRSIDSGVSSRIARAIRVDDPVDAARNLANRSRKASRISGSAAVAARSSNGSVGDVAGHSDAADFGGHALSEPGIEVADGDPGAFAREPARGRRTQSGCAPGDDDGLILQLHDVLPGEIVARFWLMIRLADLSCLSMLYFSVITWAAGVGE